MVVTMPEANICRLCVNSCNDYKRLYDDMEVYEITVKYFDPMFLNQKHFTAVCFDCWCHIVDFHNFQQTVIVAQTKLEQDNAGGVVIKSEIPDQPQEEHSPATEHFNENIYIKNEQTQASTDSADVDDDELFLPHFWFAENMAEPIPPNMPPNEVLKFDYSKKCSVKEVTRGSMTLGKGTTTSSGNNGKKTHNAKQVAKATRVTAKGTAPSFPHGGNEKGNPKKKAISTKMSSFTPEVAYEEVSESSPQSDSQKHKYTTAREFDDLIAQFRPNLECEICSKPCPSFTALQNHCRDDHPSEEFYVLCCERKFTLRSRLEEHLRIHSDDPFKCEPCGKNFRWKITLTRHLRKCPHYQKAKIKSKAVYKCKECGELADTPSMLRNHILNVHVIRKFKCTLCEKSYTTGNSLREHMATHTGTGLHKCQHCPKSFIYRSGWRVHQRKQHAHLISSDCKPKPKSKRAKKFRK